MRLRSVFLGVMLDVSRPERPDPSSLGAPRSYTFFNIFLEKALIGGAMSREAAIRLSAGVHSAALAAGLAVVDPQEQV